jgi:peptidoglycan/xylan/chitin deacetylase (PgdA/CDA1 family)
MQLWGLVDEVQAKRTPLWGAVAITFDDGYADLLANAKPLLERADVPATAFVVAGGLGRPFWWDELAALLGTVAARRPGRVNRSHAATAPRTPMRLATPETGAPADRSEGPGWAYASTARIRWRAV